jgi:hypothetical protein
MTDLVAVVRWDRSLRNPKTSFGHREDDLGVKMPIVGERFEGNSLKRLN